MDLIVNGERRRFEGDGGTPLLLVLRDEFGLTGTKFGCGAGICGACTVHLDGQATRSCGVAVRDAAGAEIVTIEGLGAGRLHPVQRAWLTVDVAQCGYCQPGMIMAAAALLAGNPRPSREDIGEAITNLCRCGTYSRVREAVLLAASQGEG